MPAFYSFFYGGVFNTYLGLHFSVRSRALSSLVTRASSSTTSKVDTDRLASMQLVIVALYGLLLDYKKWSLKKRAVIGCAVWAIPQAGCFIWTGINYGNWGTTGPYHAYDYGK